MPNQIQVLDPHVADLIAAGEVVERPASVVKELVENAVDAGAHTLTVEIQRGGMAMIRVTDDGGGIPADQCQTAFLRHATSKLRTAQDLAAIGTLGFRGEALAAIAAVSRVELFTRTAQCDLGTSLTLEGGQVLSQEPAGCPLGTTLVVRDLFYNTPARLKFMKRDAAEGAAVFALVQKLALSHPGVSFQFIRDGKRELMTPGDEDVTVTGFVSLPACCRGSRTYQHFFVNGRPVKSKLLMAALERAYENQKMVGKFPGCVLQLQVKASQVDVNVHPAKTEVKFLHERQVFDGVYYGVLSALQGETRHPTVTFAPPQPSPQAGSGGEQRPPLQPAQGKPVLRDAAGALLRPLERAYTPASPLQGESVPGFSPKSAGKSTDFCGNVDKPVENVEKPRPAAVPRPDTPHRTPSVPQQAPAPQLKLKVPPAPLGGAEGAPVPPPSLEEEAPWRLAGEILQTYLIVEQGDAVHLIDKHAAHERMQFDRMKAAGRQQGLGHGLVPRRLHPVKPALSEIAGQLLTGGGADPQAARDAVLHTMACKAAVKGGQRNTREELLVVVREVMAGRVKYCPHGRPVAITMTRSQLERQFKRSS